MRRKQRPSFTSVDGNCRQKKFYAAIVAHCIRVGVGLLWPGSNISYSGAHRQVRLLNPSWPASTLAAPPPCQRGQVDLGYIKWGVTSQPAQQIDNLGQWPQSWQLYLSLSSGIYQLNLRQRRLILMLQYDRGKAHITIWLLLLKTSKNAKSFVPVFPLLADRIFPNKMIGTCYKSL